MPKRIKEGTGMMQRETLIYDLTKNAGKAEIKECTEAIRRWFAQPVGDELREENAQRCREILDTVGLGDMMEGTCAVNNGKLRAKGLNEDSAQWLAALWLGAFNRLRIAQTHVEAGKGDVSLLIDHAQELGRIQERMFWRSGVDPETGERREKLALERRHARKRFAEVSEGRSAANAKRKDEAMKLTRIAQGIADEYWHRNPDAPKSQVAKHVVRKWPEKDSCGIDKPSENTVRQRITKT